MEQFISSLVLVAALIGGMYAYTYPNSPFSFMSPKPIQISDEIQRSVGSRQMDVTTNGAGVQISGQAELDEEQKKIVGMIDLDQQALMMAQQEIEDINKELSKGGFNILRIMALKIKLSNDQHVVDGYQRKLTALNAQLYANRQLMAMQRQAATLNSHDQSAALVERVKEQIDEQRQRMKDRQSR
jgi:hypothetical protein